MQNSVIRPPQLYKYLPGKKTIGLVGLTILLAGGAGWWLGAAPRHSDAVAEATEQGEQPLRVNTVLASKSAAAGKRTLTGTLEPVEEVTLASRVMGLIQQLPVDEGDYVEAGQLIAEIDVNDIQAQRNQAEAAIPQARAAVSVAQSAYITAQSQQNQALSARDEAIAAKQEAESKLQEARAQREETQAELADAKLHQRRMEMLQSEGAVSQSQLDRANTEVARLEAHLDQMQARIEQNKSALAQAENRIQQANMRIDQAEAQVQQAEAEVDRARAGVDEAIAGVEQTQANLDYGTLTAPFDGVITRKHTEIGAMAGAGQPIVTIESTNRLDFSVPVPESAIGQFAKGDRVSVYIDALQRSISGRVNQIIPSADPKSRNFTIEIRLSADRDAIPGMFGRLKLDTSDRQILTLPETALVKRLGIAGVYKIENGKADFQQVTTGATHDGEIEIFSGVGDGDRIVVNPSSELADGRPVRY